MHNCKQTRKVFDELAVAEHPVISDQLRRQLDDCAACREEFASLQSALHVSAQALRLTLPGEDFWQGYHERLRAKVLANAAQVFETQTKPLSFSRRAWPALRTFASSSVRLPLPAALAAVLLVGVSFAILLKTARASVTAANNQAKVETRTIEVPVVQEKVVTKVVYVERKNGRSGRRGELNSVEASDLSQSVAAVSSRKNALSMVGFKPTDQVKLTIIKGSYQDEK